MAKKRTDEYICNNCGATEKAVGESYTETPVGWVAIYWHEMRGKEEKLFVSADLCPKCRLLVEAAVPKIAHEDREAARRGKPDRWLKEACHVTEMEH